MKREDFIDQLNEWGKANTPFFFLIDFEMLKPYAFPLSELSKHDVRFDFNGKGNQTNSTHQVLQLSKKSINESLYQKKFQIVFNHLLRGDSFLTNLTIKTPIQTNYTLKEIYQFAHAPYKLLFKNECVVYSPETFVKIKEGKIFSNPMKGTIDASIPNAATIILNDQKELAEHITIVDLIRNDLSTVAENVRVTKFRYIDTIKTHERTLLQVSSEIEGDLPNDYLSRIGTILVSLLPAGSVSGAPKKKTIEIIQEAEIEPRGYYTGVMGYFDGKVLDSAVMIRYIENVKGDFFYRSGGGITAQSDCLKEYEEALAKVYVPVV